ncbi:MAG TPA: hypothetical protein PL017_00470 [Tenuifilaceae bacterium]|nr:hypothetical protein [Tenuifilaceae bacterium]HPE17313.1 hypothetical protein [Tenuifilaceae bacterium]HPJ44539.1 hypothetical protein [Tenuifilaceae bacterium]HPQ33077.1 hypothetical protein [Tenuifilaceae bacterium]HRX67621.1 hypothetical protein [Tenuifilaceae bacterium]
MHKLFLFALALTLTPIVMGVTTQTQANIISAKLKVQKASQGKKIVIEADVFYLIDSKEIRMYYIYPEEFIFFSNILGETKMYFPKKNEVILQQNDIFSADTDILFLFLTQNMSEMGLKQMGFELTESKYDNNYHITKWASPESSKGIAEIELVFEDFVPIFTSFISNEKNTLSKTYYDNYQEFNNHYIPLTITEISYINNNDSIVSRKEYSDLRYGSQVSSDMINFKIPDNAKVIK